MILYNVTVIMEEDIYDDWMNWMKKEHIPEVMATSMFVSYRMLKVVDSPNEGVTCCMQYIAESMEKYQEYQDKYAAALQASFPARFENKFVVYRTVMEFIDQG